MAYFDDPKNRESWEKAMVALRIERERRLSGEEPAAVSAARELHYTQEAGKERLPISFQQILAEYQAEREEKGISAPAVGMSGPNPVRERERAVEGRTQAMQGPELANRSPRLPV